MATIFVFVMEEHGLNKDSPGAWCYKLFEGLPLYDTEGILIGKFFLVSVPPWLASFAHVKSASGSFFFLQKTTRSKPAQASSTSMEFEGIDGAALHRPLFAWCKAKLSVIKR